jgi:hypothetical protein
MRNKKLYFLSVTIVMLLQHYTVTAQYNYLQPETVENGIEVLYTASNTIYSPPDVAFVVVSGGRAELKAGSRIELHPGFQVQNGGMLSATIETPEPTDPGDNESVSVYPNPTEGLINVVSPTPVDDARLVDIYGFVVLEQKAIGVNEFTMDLTALKAGIYILEIISGKTNELIRLEKK